MYGGNSRLSGYWNNQNCAKSGQYICERVIGRYTYRGVARALIGGRCTVIDSCFADGFLLKSVVFKLFSKEISRAEHEYMNTPPPPPPN